MQVDKEKLKELMKKNEIKNFTQLAICLGISKNQLSNILSDKFNDIPIRSILKREAFMEFLQKEWKVFLDSKFPIKKEKFILNL